MAELIGYCCHLSMELCCDRRKEKAMAETERELVAELVAAGTAVAMCQVDVRDTVTADFTKLALRRQDGTSLGLLPKGTMVQVLSSYEVVSESADCFGHLPPSKWFLEVVPPDTLQPPEGATSGGNDLSKGLTTAANVAPSSSGWVRLEPFGYLKKYNVALAG